MFENSQKGELLAVAGNELIVPNKHYQGKLWKSYCADVVEKRIYDWQPATLAPFRSINGDFLHSSGSFARSEPEPSSENLVALAQRSEHSTQSLHSHRNLRDF